MSIGTAQATSRSQSARQGWPSEPGSGRGRRHGTSSSEAFDRWFRYPAGFASDYAEMLLGRIGLDHGTVIDPFTGSGVTGTAARRMGLAFVGLEAHPLVAELARLNLYPRVDAASVSAGADEVVAEVRALPVRTEQEAEVGMLPDAHLNEADQGGLADAVVALESGESLHIEAGNDAKPGPPAVLNLEVHQ